MSNVLLVTELKNGSITKASLTALSFARQAASRTGGSVHAVVIGSGVSAAAEEISKYV